MRAAEGIGAEAFFTHNGVRAYHSGDLAVWTEDGEIRIFGRLSFNGLYIYKV